MQKAISYTELIELESKFDAQMKAKRLKFINDESRELALLEFNQQYINGNDNPTIEELDLKDTTELISGSLVINFSDVDNLVLHLEEVISQINENNSVCGTVDGENNYWCIKFDY